MNKVIIYIKDSVSLDDAYDSVNKASTVNDELVVFFHLSELSRDVVPLIGDLKEIRSEKYKRLLNEWFIRENFKFTKFTPVILQGDFDKNSIQKYLNEGENTDILLFTPLLGKIKGAFRELEKSFAFRIIENFKNDESSAEACE